MSGPPREAGPPFLDAAAVERLLPPAAAIDALEAALLAGLDPERDAPRSSVATGRGELLLMPSNLGGVVGVKLATVAPGNPGRGLPRIQGLYVLFDPETLAPALLVDGIALTSVRTAAVSGLAVRHLAAPGARRMVLFGSGPQARSHVAAFRTVRPLRHVDVVARDPGRLAALVEHCRTLGLTAAAPAGAALEEALRAADIVCCATTAREPLFDGDLPDTRATVVAIGSHEPEAREVDERLARRATVVVEARSSALREAGDVISAAEAGALDTAALLTLDAVVRGTVRVPEDRPRLFKSTGMAWEDAVVAGALADAHRTAHRIEC